MLAAITTTLLLTVGFAFVIASMDREIVKANWDKERCNITTMFAASLYKPDDDKRTGGQFASDNFKFCVEKLADSVIQSAFAPLFGVVSQQMDAQSTTVGSLNNLRGMVKTVKDKWDSFIGKLFQRYVIASIAFLKTQQHLKFAMDRLGTMMLSMVYLIMSAVTLGNNIVKLIFLVVIIVIGILVGLVVILFFVLFPVFPVILGTIGALSAVGIGVAGASAFCVDPSALVQIADGTTKPLQDIQLGELLFTKTGETNRVTGILTADCKDHELVSIDGVLMSQSHRVYHQGNWMLAREHPNAIQTTSKLDKLICLNTTTHSVPIVAKSSILIVGDWEEFTTDEGQSAWIDYIGKLLNGENYIIKSYPSTVPLVGNNVHVYKYNVGWIPISKIIIGDLIKSGEEYTVVKGIYKGALYVSELPNSPEWISDGVWGQRVDGTWSPTIQDSVKSNDASSQTLDGIFLVVADETFSIRANSKELVVRDFTEIGVSNLEASYSMIDSYVNKK